MALKFRRRVTVFPGVRLNLSMQGISTTIGPPGFNVNFNRKGTHLNTGIPGTGIYDRQRIGGRRSDGSRKQALIDRHYEAPEYIVPPGISLENATCEGLEDLRNTLVACLTRRKKLRAEITEAKKAFKRAKNLLLASKILIVGFFIYWFAERRDAKEAILAELEEELQMCSVDVDVETDPDIRSQYESVESAFEEMTTCHAVWDISARLLPGDVQRRSHKAAALHRIPVSPGFAQISALNTEIRALHFEDATGADLYFYPAFVVLIDGQGKFALMDLSQVRMTFRNMEFPETGIPPPDAEVTGHTWFRANKDGSPDRRFNDNYEIPVCRYGVIEIEGSNGLQKEFAFSNPDKAKSFVQSFGAYCEILGKN